MRSSFIAAIVASLASVVSADFRYAKGTFEYKGEPKHSRIMKFNEDYTFRIAQLTDLSWADDTDIDNDGIQLAHNLSRKVDLVVITGDLTDGNLWNGKDKDWWVKKMQRLKYVLGNTSFAYLPGYHDYEADADEEEQLIW